MAQVRPSIYIYIFQLYESIIIGKLNSSLTPAFICGIAARALSAKNFKPPTVRSYLFILATVHKLKIFSAHSCSNSLVKCVLKGAGKLAFYTTISNESKKVIFLPLLKLLGQEISKTSWTVDSKQVFWSACVTAFFSSL